MQKKSLLITDTINEEYLPLLEKQFTITKYQKISQEELHRVIKNYDALITRSPTSITKELIQTSQRISIIGRAAIGVDNIDIQEATKKKIAVLNAPKGNAISTAEHTIGMILALLRHIPQAHISLTQGIWGKQQYIGTQLLGKTLGIVGFGNVGKEVYRLAHGIGMNVLVCEPYMPLPSAVTKCTFEQLLSESDIVTFHVPATYLTKQMLNAHTLSLCKPGAYIINCSRGAVIDEDAIIHALQNNTISGFAVDVYPKEPEVNKTLHSLPNVITTPHIAGSTHESQKESVREVVTGILQYLEGKVPHNLLNPQVFEKKSRTLHKTPLFNTIIFDCDSTLCDIEGIDELAAMYKKKKEIATLTAQAMEGVSSFEDVYRKRLDIIHPTLQDIHDIGKTYIDHLVLDAKPVIHALLSLKKKVYIISSGYWASLSILAEHLGIPKENVFGNDLMFDADGKYMGIVEGPLIRNHGKLQIIRQLTGKKAIIGDSVTDMECQEVVDLFIGYGGVVSRKKVQQESPMFLHCESMTPLLPLLCSQKELQSLVQTPYKKYVGKGIDLLSHPKQVTVSDEWKERLSSLKTLAYY